MVVPDKTLPVKKSKHLYYYITPEKIFYRNYKIFLNNFIPHFSNYDKYSLKWQFYLRYFSLFPIFCQYLIFFIFCHITKNMKSVQGSICFGPKSPTRKFPMAQYSLVIPVYNEEESLKELYREITEVAQSGNDDIEIIFIAIIKC